MVEERRLGQGLTGRMPLHLDIDPHGRVAAPSEEARRALADRAGRFALLPAAADLLLAVRVPPAGGVSPLPRCTLAGDLSAFPIADFVAFLHQSKLSGVLTVGSGGVERSISFRDGQARSAGSEAPGERIGEVALRLGHVTAEQLALAGDAGRPMGRALVESGFLTPSDLWKCFHEQVAAVFHSILLARQGWFHLVEEPEGDRPGVPLAVDTQSLLMDGIRRIDEMSLFRVRIPGPEAYLRRREPHRTVALRPAEQELLELVDGRRRVREVAAAAHLSEFDATKILYHLAEAGHVEAVAEPSAVAGDGGGRLESIVDGFDAILREIAAAVRARQQLDGFLAGARGFLADPVSRFAPLWRLVVPDPDGAVGKGAVLGNLSAVRGAGLQKVEPSGDAGRFLFDALRELMFFYLFLAGERLPRADDDALSERVKRRLEPLESLR